MSRDEAGRLRVAVVGAPGRMGSLACAAVEAQPDLELVARVGRGDSLDACAAADVVVELGGEQASWQSLRWALEHSTSVVLGSSGVDLDEVRRAVERHGPLTDVAVVVVPNFSVSALLVRRFAAAAAPHFDSVAVVEYAGSHKKDAPSATAVEAARHIAAARRHAPGGTDDAERTPPGAVVDGVPIASVRLAGLLSHQQVILSSPGDAVTLRFDTTDRSAYTAGIVAATRAAGSRTGLLVGLDSVIPL